MKKKKEHTFLDYLVRMYEAKRRYLIARYNAYKNKFGGKRK